LNKGRDGNAYLRNERRRRRRSNTTTWYGIKISRVALHHTALLRNIGKALNIVPYLAQS
jgi:hypothetical protein